ncbi:dihydroorotase [Treponema sp.]
MRTLLQGFRIVDADQDFPGALLIEDGLIAGLYPDRQDQAKKLTLRAADRVISGDLGEGRRLAFLPSFVELHAHFRDPGYPEKESLESASLAAAQGGYGTVVCMANTKPVLDSTAAAEQLKQRSDSLGLIDLYPALSLTKGMDGHDVSHLGGLASPAVRLLSEDGKDVMDDEVFRQALRQAATLGLPVSCHCDVGGEDEATRRALALAQELALQGAGGHIHLAHVSTQGAIAALREAKVIAVKAGAGKLRISAEATPHHLALTEADAIALGETSWGRVNPALRRGADRLAVIQALVDGTIDAIATDHAPHTTQDKEGGAPGFTGLETAFAVSYTELVAKGHIDLCRLSKLMSASAAELLSFADRGRIKVGLRADLVLIDLDEKWLVDPARFSSKGKNTPFAGTEVQARIQACLRGGRLSYDRSYEK